MGTGSNLPIYCFLIGSAILMIGDILGGYIGYQQFRMLRIAGSAFFVGGSILLLQ